MFIFSMSCASAHVFAVFVSICVIVVFADLHIFDMSASVPLLLLPSCPASLVYCFSCVDV